MTDYCRKLTFTKEGKTYIIRDEETYQAVQSILNDGIFVATDQGVENAGKFVKVDSEGNITVESVTIPVLPEGLVEDVADLKDEMTVLTEDSYEEIDLVALATTVTNHYITSSGSVGDSEVWNYYKVSKPENCNFVRYKCYQGAQAPLPMVAFYSSTTVSSTNYISGDNAGGTITNNYIENTVEIPEGTKLIVFSTKYAEGGLPIGIGIGGTQGTIPAMQTEMDAMQAEIEAVQDALEHIAGKKVKDGLKIAILGDSISTSTRNRMPEIKIQAEDVGVQLGAWLTYHDVTASAPLTLGGVTYTTDDIGKYIIFTPTQADVGKTIGNEKMYNGTGTKVWWEYLKEDLGADTINATWCSASLSSHEKTSVALQTSYGWHPSQIRRLGKRIPGTMRREAPDLVLVYRGTNDMTHSPYSQLEDWSTANKTWTYPTDDKVNSTYSYTRALGVFINTVHKVYPRAKIVLCTLNNFKRVSYSKFPVNNGTYTLQEYDKNIRDAADWFGLHTIDFDKDGITYENMYPYYISDSATTPTHPNNNGHKVMALQAITDLCNKAYLLDMEPGNLEGKVDHQIVPTLTHCTIDNTAFVYTGETFTAMLEPEEGYAVSTCTVKMGGTVVANAFDANTSTITVENVNGDITIENTVVEVEMVNVTQTLTHATSSFTKSRTNKNMPRSITITPEAGYAIDTITVTMGGDDITNDVYTYYAGAGEIVIASATGDITITATTISIGSDYTALKALRAPTVNSYIATDFCGGGEGATMDTSVKKVVTKIGVDAGGVRNSQGFGIFADIFCNMLSTGRNPDIQWSLGSGRNTGTTPIVGQDYFAELDNINASTSTFKMFLANKNAIGAQDGATCTRSGQFGDERPFAYLGFSTSSSGYGCNLMPFYYSYCYNNNDELIKYFIPVHKVSTNKDGILDTMNNAFFTFPS